MNTVVKFCTIKEAARILGVHRYTVWRWTVENKIQFRQVRAGHKILIPRAEIERLKAPSPQIL